MATNMQLLKAKIRERAMTQAQVAAAIGMDESTLSRKLKTDGLSFSIGEMHKLAALLQLTAEEATRIFLA